MKTISKKLFSAFFAAAALAGGALPAAAEQQQAQGVKVVENAVLKQARTELRSAIERMLRPHEQHRYSSYYAMRELALAHSVLMPEAIAGAGKGIDILPMKEWPELIAILGAFAMRSSDEIRNSAVEHVARALSNAQNSMDVLNSSVREESVKVQAAVALHFPGAIPMVKDHMDAVLLETDSLSSSGARAVLQYVLRQVEIGKAKHVADLYPAVKKRLDIWQKKYAAMNAEARDSYDAELQELAEDFREALRTYTELSAALPEKAPEALEIFRVMLDTKGKNDDINVMSKVARIGVVRAELADKAFDLILASEKKTQDSYAVVEALKEMGRKQPVATARALDFLFKRLEAGEIRSLDAIRTIAADTDQDVGAKVKKTLLELMKKEVGVSSSAAQSLASYAYNDKEFAAVLMPEFKALSDKNSDVMYDAEVLRYIYSIGKEHPAQRAVALEILKDALEKTVDSGEIYRLETLAQHIRGLKEATYQDDLKAQREQKSLAPQP